MNWPSVDSFFRWSDLRSLSTEMSGDERHRSQAAGITLYVASHYDAAWPSAPGCSFYTIVPAALRCIPRASCSRREALSGLCIQTREDYFRPRQSSAMVAFFCTPHFDCGDRSDLSSHDAFILNCLSFTSRFRGYVIAIAAASIIELNQTLNMVTLS